MDRKKSILLGIVLLLGALITYSLLSKEDVQRDLKSQVFQGPFVDIVSSTGELRARNSEKIRGPSQMRRYGLYNVKIAELVPEGSYVEEGEVVAKLDKTELSSQLSSVYTDLEKARSQYTQVRLDTALKLRDLRSSIESLEFDIRQKQNELDQSKYEPPATIQRLKLDLEKLRQKLRQTRENYEINKEQSEAKMQEASATLSQERAKYEALQELEKEFIIRAPKRGMVIYKRTYNGGKRTTGSTISPWDPVVATLPDLSTMESQTFINEVDIRKVEEGQNVEIGLDALPEEMLTGTVTSVANVGEKRERSDSKVFEVVIEVNESDSAYRPGMTTSNNIVTRSLDSVVQLPLEAVFTQGDTTFVYTQNGVSTYRQEVELGLSNDQYGVVKRGVEPGATVYLNEPQGSAQMEWHRLPISQAAQSFKNENKSPAQISSKRWAANTGPNSAR